MHSDEGPKIDRRFHSKHKQSPIQFETNLRVRMAGERSDVLGIGMRLFASFGESSVKRVDFTRETIFDRKPTNWMARAPFVIYNAVAGPRGVMSVSKAGVRI